MKKSGGIEGQESPPPPWDRTCKNAIYKNTHPTDALSDIKERMTATGKDISKTFCRISLEGGLGSTSHEASPDKLDKSQLVQGLTKTLGVDERVARAAADKMDTEGDGVSFAAFAGALNESPQVMNNNSGPIPSGLGLPQKQHSFNTKKKKTGAYTPRSKMHSYNSLHVDAAEASESADSPSRTATHSPKLAIYTPRCKAPQAYHTHIDLKRYDPILHQGESDQPTYRQLAARRVKGGPQKPQCQEDDYNHAQHLPPKNTTKDQPKPPVRWNQLSESEVRRNKFYHYQDGRDPITHDNRLSGCTPSKPQATTEVEKQIGKAPSSSRNRGDAIKNLFQGGWGSIKESEIVATTPRGKRAMGTGDPNRSYGSDITEPGIGAWLTRDSWDDSPRHKSQTPPQHHKTQTPAQSNSIAFSNEPGSAYVPVCKLWD